MATLQVVVAHGDRATLRVGDVFVKLDADHTRTDIEVEAMTMAPVPTPHILWRNPPVLALAAVGGTALGHLGEPSTASSAAWAAAGAAVRVLHDAPLPPWPGRNLDELASHLARECDWLVDKDVLPADLITRHRRSAETALRPWTPVFIHGDLQVDHVFLAADEVTGIVDWSEAAPGDALYDPATLTLGHPEHLGDLTARLRQRRRPRHHPRVVVVAMPDQRPLAGRARLRAARGLSRGRRASLENLSCTSLTVTSAAQRSLARVPRGDPLARGPARRWRPSRQERPFKGHSPWSA